MQNPSELNLKNIKKRKRSADDSVKTKIDNLLENEIDKIKILSGLLAIFRKSAITQSQLQVELGLTGAHKTLKRISELFNPKYHKTEKRKYNDIKILTEFLLKIKHGKLSTETGNKIQAVFNKYENLIKLVLKLQAINAADAKKIDIKIKIIKPKESDPEIFGPKDFLSLLLKNIILTLKCISQAEGKSLEEVIGEINLEQHRKTIPSENTITVIDLKKIADYLQANGTNEEKFTSLVPMIFLAKEKCAAILETNLKYSQAQTNNPDENIKLLEEILNIIYSTKITQGNFLNDLKKDYPEAPVARLSEIFTETNKNTLYKRFTRIGFVTNYLLRINTLSTEEIKNNKIKSAIKNLFTESEDLLSKIEDLQINNARDEKAAKSEFNSKYIKSHSNWFKSSDSESRQKKQRTHANIESSDSYNSEDYQTMDSESDANIDEIVSNSP